jgi:hypothetical protein
MKNLKHTYLLFIILGIGACAAPTLEEKLSGKTGDERMETLYHDCIQRANYVVPGGHNKEYIGHEGRLWKICERMYEAGKEGNSADTKRTALAQECSTEISNGYQSENPANVRHFQRVQKICQEMTGKPITLQRNIN